MRKHLYFLVFTLLSLLSFGQTVGTIEFNVDASDGYVIMNPLGFDTTYLLDNCGRIMNKWPSIELNGMFAEITPDGTLLKSAVDPSNTAFSSGGASGLLQEYNWNGDLIWQHSISSSLERAHHDLERLPNGNILVVAWEKKNSLECSAAGRNPAVLAQNELWSTVVYEIEIVYPNSANIIWEWHAWDHLIQDFDVSKGNFGVVSLNPGRLDINRGNPIDHPDWAHVNGIDYDPILDHIILSSPMFNELWIIDHSTTTLEASGTAGGERGKGGDLIWRWGNPASYDSGNSVNQQLFFQHNGQWVKNGVRFNEQISVFSNRDTINGALGSKVKIIDASFDTFSNEYPMSGGVFLPNFPSYEYEIIDTLFSPRVSGVEVLPNDHLLIASGSNGHVFEIDSNENLVWEYVVPINPNGTILAQGDNSPLHKSVFVMKRYAPNFIGFSNQTLIPGNQIELNPTECITVSLEEHNKDLIMKAYPNPVTESITISIGLESQLVTVHDNTGRIVIQKKVNGRTSINCSDWSPGIYTISSNDFKSTRIVKID
jgi:hypothetical protein